MGKLLSLLQDGEASVKLEISGSDLLQFSDDLINKAKSELSEQMEQSRAEKYLTKEEVKKMFDVCDATLWHWNKKSYLKTIKVGNKVRYLQSDINKLLSNKK